MLCAGTAFMWHGRCETNVHAVRQGTRCLICGWPQCSIPPVPSRGAHRRRLAVPSHLPPGCSGCSGCLLGTLCLFGNSRGIGKRLRLRLGQPGLLGGRPISMGMRRSIRATPISLGSAVLPHLLLRTATPGHWHSLRPAMKPLVAAAGGLAVSPCSLSGDLPTARDPATGAVGTTGVRPHARLRPPGTRFCTPHQAAIAIMQ